jgi:flagellar basal-body rod protein FlgB
LRHAAQAQNISNATIAGYRPLKVNFEQQLNMARSQLLARDDEAGSRRALNSVQPRVEEIPELSPDGNETIKLDAEVAKMMQNAVFYQSLLTALGKNHSILRMAVRGGGG